MNETLASILGSSGGALGFIAATLAGAAFVYHRYRRDDTVNDKSATSYNNQLDRMTAIVKDADERTKEAWARVALADERTNQAYRERNDLMLKLSEMTSKISALTLEVARLNTEIANLQNKLETRHGQT